MMAKAMMMATSTVALALTERNLWVLSFPSLLRCSRSRRRSHGSYR